MPEANIFDIDIITKRLQAIENKLDELSCNCGGGGDDNGSGGDDSGNEVEDVEVLLVGEGNNWSTSWSCEVYGIKFTVTEKLLENFYILKGISVKDVKGSGTGIQFFVFVNNTLKAITDYLWTGFESLNNNATLNKNIELKKDDEVIILPCVARVSGDDSLVGREENYVSPVNEENFSIYEGKTLQYILEQNGSLSFFYYRSMSVDRFPEDKIWHSGFTDGTDDRFYVPMLAKEHSFRENKSEDDWVAIMGDNGSSNLTVRLMFKDTRAKEYSPLYVTDEEKSLIKKLLVSTRTALAEKSSIDKVEDVAAQE